MTWSIPQTASSPIRSRRSGNDKLRGLAKARDDRERAQREDRLAVDESVRARLVAMTTDFKKTLG